MRPAESLVTLALIYAAVGGLFACVFVIRGVHKVDAAAKGAPWSFRLMILPGAAALWPLLAKRWFAK